MITVDNHMSGLLADLDRLVTEGATSDPVHTFFESHFRLPGNPFPPPGIANSMGFSPPLRDRVFDQIYNFVRRGYSTRQRQFLVVRGDYGSGKTQTLRFIEYIVNTHMNKGDHAARAIFVERPRLEAQELNRSILRTLGQDTVNKYVWFVIRGELLKDLTNPSSQYEDLKRTLIAQRGQTGRGRKGRQSQPPSGQLGLLADDNPALTAPFDSVFKPDVIRDYRTFLSALEGKGWSREDVRSYLSVLLQRALASPDTRLTQTFVALLLAPDEATFSSWEALLAITNTKMALPLRVPDFLRFLLQIMALNGIVYVYMLLDEFEEVSQTALLTTRQRQDYMYTLREVLNSIQDGLSVIIGISSPGWDAIQVEAVPFADVTPEIVGLGRIELSDALKLVQFYLDQEREGTAYPQGDLYPFSRDVIDYILRRFPKPAQRTPRNLIQFMYLLLNYAAEHGITTLTSEVADPLLTEFGTVRATRDRAPRGRRAPDDAAPTSR